MSALPKYDIELKPLSEEEVISSGLPDTDLWFLFINEVTHGPYSGESLKEFLDINSNFDSQTLACTKDDPTWRPLFEYPVFSRRKPQEVPKEIEDAMPEVFYILKNGQPFGPLELNDIRKLVESTELIYTDQVSLDEGASWHKLHELPMFERREHSNDDLPFLPDENKFKNKTERIFKLLNKSDENDAIFSIADVHNKHSGESNLVEPEIQSSKTSNGTGSEKKGLNKPLIMIVVSLLVAYAMYALKPGPKPVSEVTPKQTKTTEKQVKKKTPKNTVQKNKSRNSKLEKPRGRSQIRTQAIDSKVETTPKIRKPGSIKGKSRKTFNETSTYQEFHSQKEENAPDQEQNTANDVEEENFEENYDDGDNDVIDDEGFLGEETSEDEINDNVDNDIESELEF